LEKKIILQGKLAVNQYIELAATAETEKIHHISTVPAFYSQGVNLEDIVRLIAK
jgi:hypothetical protein